jgi:pilus assembly protein CpaE
VLATFSLRGGVGCSTLAVNLAVALAQLWGQPTALVDLSLANGQCALMLGLPNHRSWTALTRQLPDSLDEVGLQKALMPHRSGVYLLAAPHHPEEAETVTGAYVARALELLSGLFPYVVIDLGHDFGENSLAALDVAQLVLLMLSPDLAAVQSGTRALSIFEKLRYPANKVQPVFNGALPHAGLSRIEVDAALAPVRPAGGPPLLALPHVPDVLTLAINNAAPVTFAEPESLFGALLEDLAFYFSAEVHKKKRPENPSPAWQRVVARLQKRKS